MNKNDTTGLPEFTAEAALGQTSGRYRKWSLDFATKVSASLAAEAIGRSMGIK